MTYSNLQIEIIKLLGSKELLFGCIVSLKKKYENPYFSIDTSDTLSVVHIDNKYECLFKLDWIRWVLELWNQWKKYIEILWHLPTLEDLFIKAEEKGITIRIDNETLLIITTKPVLNVIEIPYNPKLKPYQQTEETMQELITLFK